MITDNQQERFSEASIKEDINQVSKNLIILYESGLTIDECARRVNLNKEKAISILKENRKFRTKRYLSELSPEEIQNILSLYKEGKNAWEICKETGLAQPSLGKLLKAHNIDIKLDKRFDIIRATPINAIQKQILVGTMLGDGRLCKTSTNGNWLLQIGHCEKQAEYFHWKIMMMDPFINNWLRVIDRRGNSIMLMANSITHQDFNEFGKMFYDHATRKKILPKNLDLWLTPLALAVWIQDDGNLHAGVNQRIATMNFTEEENYRLRDYLCQCFDIRSKVHRYKYKTKYYDQLVLNKENTQKLSDIIRPYVVPCMQYKLMPEKILND